MTFRLALFALWAVAGTASASPAPVVGGQQAPLGAWQDTAGVVFNYGVGCTGVLVAPTVVLTASHCLDGARVRSVVLGTNDYASDDAVNIRVAEQFQYPGWWSSYDIAVLVLEEPAPMYPRVIAQGCVNEQYLYDGAPVAIVGYGAHDERGYRYDSKLREAFTVVTDYDCTQVERGCTRSISPGGQIGAGGDGVDACFGDSGGPLYLQTEVGDYVVGLTETSWNDVPYNAPCREGGIYVRPDAVLQWLEDTSGVDLPEPTCEYVPAPRGQEKSVSLPGGDWWVSTQPQFGTARVEGSRLIYTSDDDYLGKDQVAVSSASGDAWDLVQFEVVEGGGCGCTTSALPASAWLAGLLGLLAVRRRRE